MEPSDKIQQLFQFFEKLNGQMENIQIQLTRIAADRDRESEKGTIAREHKRLQEELDKVDDLLYNRETGIAFELDRLKEREKKRDAMWKVVWGLCVVVGGMIIKELILFIKK